MSDLPLIPFALTSERNLELLHLDGLARDPEVVLVDDPSRGDFCRLLNHTNQLAFGGETNMGMPPWVMLDCGILSCAIVGFAMRREDLPDGLDEAIGVPQDYGDLVPVSEYCACPTLEPNSVSGFSLAAQLTGHGVATRTKALALAIYGSRSQIGVTQFDNPAIRVHAKLGPMEVTLHRPSVHTHAANSFAYRLDLPDRPTLIAIADGTRRRAEHAPLPGEALDFDPTDETHHARLRDAVASRRPVHIVQPGWVDGLLPMVFG